MCEFSHECSKTNARVLQLGRPNKLYGEPDRMDAHPTLTCARLSIQSVDRKDDLFNRSTCEFIAKNIDGYLFFIVVERSACLRNPFDG